MRLLPFPDVCLILFATGTRGQIPTAPAPQPAHIAGTVTDTNDDIIPGATVTVEAGSGSPQTVVANDNGFFEIGNLTAGTHYEISVRAKGFVGWRSQAISLSPGQFDILADVKLTVLGDETFVTVVTSHEEIATEEVRIEEHQRVLGFIPNFYVSYDKNPAPLTPRLKFEMALKVAIDPVTFAGTTFLAASDQASHYPDYQEGLRAMDNAWDPFTRTI